MGAMELTEDLLSIGRFSHLSGLTIKALRHYDEIGLLRPARVDDSSGYRYYSLAQVREAEAIRRLRSLDMPLDEIGGLLGADERTVRERLAVHRARIEGRAVETGRILAELDRLIDGKEKLVPEAKDLIQFELEIKDVPVRRVAFVRERAHQDELKEVIPAAIDRVARAIGMRHAGPPCCRTSDPDGDGYLDVETGWPVPDDVEPEPPVEVTTFGGSRALVLKHVGPMEELSRSYRLMMEAMEGHGLVAAGDPVEWYESDPKEVPDPKVWVTIIEWPIGPEGRLS
jgi:DNA-binding transcriptional MerR regulator